MDWTYPSPCGEWDGGGSRKQTVGTDTACPWTAYESDRDDTVQRFLFFEMIMVALNSILILEV